MSPLVQTVNQILSLCTVAAQAFIAVSLVLYVVWRNTKNPFFDFVARRALPLSFLVALAAVAGSLFYSEIAGFEPCKLCWFQRIFMYPQVVLLGLAMVVRDTRIAGTCLCFLRSEALSQATITCCN